MLPSETESADWSVVALEVRTTVQLRLPAGMSCCASRPSDDSGRPSSKAAAAAVEEGVPGSAVSAEPAGELAAEDEAPAPEAVPTS